MLRFLNLEMGIMSIKSFGGAGDSSDGKDCFPGPPASLIQEVRDKNCKEGRQHFGSGCRDRVLGGSKDLGRQHH